MTGSTSDPADSITFAVEPDTSGFPAVVDAAFRCLGVVQAADLVRAIADSKVQEAASLNPLTRLPGRRTIATMVARKGMTTPPRLAIFSNLVISPIDTEDTPTWAICISV